MKTEETDLDCFTELMNWQMFQKMADPICISFQSWDGGTGSPFMERLGPQDLEFVHKTAPLRCIEKRKPPPKKGNKKQDKKCRMKRILQSLRGLCDIAVSIIPPHIGLVHRKPPLTHIRSDRPQPLAFHLIL